MCTISSTNDIAIANDCDKEKNIERISTATMNSSSSSSSMCSLPSRYGMFLILGCCCLWSLAFASGYNPGLPPSTTRGPSRTESRSFSPLVLEAIPGKGKFKRLRKRLSRTRRGYRNDDNIGTVEELVAETGTTQAAEEGYTINAINKDGIDSTTRTKIGKRIRAIREANQKARHSSQSSTLKKKKEKVKETVLVETVEELRHAILDQQLSLSDTRIVERVTKTSPVGATKEQAESSPLMDHAVRNLIKGRHLSRSTPGNRHSTDNSTMAIAIEGGGMRGCVSAGMVAAITALGLSDTIDTIYGSSAGSVVGAYMVSRQMCMDVYVDILPASKKLFVCKKRMIANLASLGLGRMLSSSKSSNNNKNQRAFESTRPSLTSFKERLSNTQPGMNISFVLDGILGEDHGLRPIDIDAFKENNKHQKLRVVSSCVDPHTGKLFTRCFGDDDFFHEDDAMVRADGEREGIFACLQASMTVPVSFVVSKRWCLLFAVTCANHLLTSCTYPIPWLIKNNT
jgi:hypothetical protein